MVNSVNANIRTAAKHNGVYLWEVAEALGIQDSALSRKLRKELPEKETVNILRIIDQLAKEKSEVV